MAINWWKITEPCLEMDNSSNNKTKSNRTWILYHQSKNEMKNRKMALCPIMFDRLMQFMHVELSVNYMYSMS